VHVDLATNSYKKERLASNIWYFTVVVDWLGSYWITVLLVLTNKIFERNKKEKLLLSVFVLRLLDVFVGL